MCEPSHLCKMPFKSTPEEFLLVALTEEENTCWLDNAYTALNITSGTTGCFESKPKGIRNEGGGGNTYLIELQNSKYLNAASLFSTYLAVWHLQCQIITTLDELWYSICLNVSHSANETALQMYVPNCYIIDAVDDFFNTVVS